MSTLMIFDYFPLNWIIYYYRRHFWRNHKIKEFYNKLNNWVVNKAYEMNTIDKYDHKNTIGIPKKQTQERLTVMRVCCQNIWSV